MIQRAILGIRHAYSSFLFPEVSPRVRVNCEMRQRIIYCDPVFIQVDVQTNQGGRHMPRLGPEPLTRSPFNELWSLSLCSATASSKVLTNQRMRKPSVHSMMMK